MAGQSAPVEQISNRGTSFPCAVCDSYPLLANEYDLVVGNRLNKQEMKDILPELAAHPQVVKAADEIAKLTPELEGIEKSSMKEKIKEKTKAAKPKRAKSSKKKEEVAI